MPNFNTILSKLYALVNVDANFVPTKIKSQYLPIPTPTDVGAVKVDGTSITIGGDGTISSTGGGGSGTTLMALTDVGITEPTLVNTINTVTTISSVGNSITTATTPPANLTVGDWIRGTGIANSAVVQILSITGNSISVNADPVSFGFTVNGTIYRVSSVALANQVLQWSVATNKWIAGTVTTQAYATIQNAMGMPVTQRNIVEFTGSGVSSVIDDAAGLRTVVTIAGGGGGGGAFTSTAIWTGGTASKNAFTSPGVINDQGITINLVASTGAGSISAATVSLNGVALTGTYVSTGTFPNYVITIPVADLTGNVAETVASVIVSVLGTFNGTGFNVANAGTLTNFQPIPFTTTLTGSYAVASTPFYTTVGTLNYSYSNSGSVVTFGGQFNPGGFASSATGSFTNLALTGSTISGNAVGNGLNGAGLLSVPLSGTVPAVPVYTPAFLAQTPSNVPPVFTTATSQTVGAAAGSTVTYSPAPTTSYNWVATQRPLANLALQTPFGNAPLVPDVTPPTQTISGQIFNVFGWSGLSPNSTSILVIS